MEELKIPQPTTVTDLAEYRKNVDRMWELESSRIFRNGSAAHAAIILESFLTHAQRKVQIFCNSLASDVFDLPEFIQKTKQALKRGVLVEIVVQNAPDSNSRFVSEFSDPNSDNPISLRVCGLGDPVTKSLRHNFAVADEKAYRFEPDNSDSKAMACINDAPIAQNLSNSFAKMSSLLKGV